MALFVGQKVVCIAGFSPETICPGDKLPQKGTIYRVRDQCVHSSSGTAAIRLFEIVNRVHSTVFYGVGESWYDASAFRPVVDRPTDISIFKKLLAPAQTQNLFNHDAWIALTDHPA